MFLISPNMPTISQLIFFEFFKAFTSDSIEYKLISENSYSTIFFGFPFKTCLTISEPIDPPAPVIITDNPSKEVSD